MAQNLPSKIGKYEVLEVLGQGGMGTVYKAVDPQIGRLVAIKVIVADCIDDPELLKRFYREAKAVGNLQHPNIVIVYDLGEENKNPYLVMEYLDGEPLNRIIASRREFPLLQKLAIVAKVCRALFYAHQRDIVHRDVKPANVMLLKDGQVKLLDFGIARLGNSSYRKTETRKGQVMGTISYIAPEILHEEIADGRSDVYSTGVMLFELLTFRLPFEASDLDSLIAKKMQGNPPPPLSRYIENYPPGLDEILVRALAKDRDERHGSAQDFAFDLERLIERLKRDMVSQYVERARECISIAELGQAKDLLSEVLKIDTQHTTAKQLLYEVQQSIQKQKRLEHIRQLQQHSREALAQKQFDDASKFAEEAIKLDGTDPDSLNLREFIQQAKLRVQQIKKLLHLAEIAQQSGELGVLQRAVSDALVLEPDDPQALVFQASLIRLQAEQEKEAKVKECLAAARRDIANRQFDAAQENILKAEALDPHREDIPALKQMVLAGRQQETRARQLQEFCRDIQKELDANNPISAKDLAEKALRVFPGEPALLRMKSAAESQIEAEQRCKYIAEQIASASKWLELGEPSRALTIAEQANRQFPTDTRLRDFLQVARQAVQEDTLKRGQQAVLAQAREEMRQKHFAEAMKILEAGQIKYPDLAEIGDLLTIARREQELLVRKSGIAEVSEQARDLLTQQAFGDALSLLKRALANTPDPSLEELLQSAQAQAAEFHARLDILKKETLARLESGHSAEALNELRSRADKFGSSSSFRELVQQVEERIKEEQETSQHVARVLDEASLYLRGGALQEAEAALTACCARAPQDPNVIAFSSQLMTAKAAAEKEREIRPPVEPEIPAHTEQEKNALAETVRFTPSAAVADLTPPAGSSISPKVVDSRSSPAAVSRASAEDENTLLPRNEPTPPPVPTTLERLRKQLTWKRLLPAAAAVGLILIALTVRHFWPKVSSAPPSPQSRMMAMHISTVPKGAKILVDHVFRGTSDVHIDLTFGDHQLQASMPGYKDAATALSLKPGSVSNAVLTLDPLPPQAWIASTDLESAEVWLDGALLGRLQEGSLQLPALSAGHHTVRVAVPPKIGQDVVLSVDSTPGALPEIALQSGTHQTQVVVIRSNDAVITVKGSIVATNVTLDGNPVGQLTSNGLDINNVKPGVHEFAFEQKNATQKISLTINQSPTVHTVLFSPQNVGSVLVETGENNARVYVDGHLTSKTTVNGQLRIPNLSIGKHEVRVVKDGFNDSLPQIAHVRPAQEAKLEFALAPKAAPGPPTATLAISNAPQGGDVFLDNSSIGIVPASGAFAYDHVAIGYHAIEIRKEGYQSLSVSRNFAVGTTVTVNGSETPLLTGIVEVNFAFPGRVTLSRGVDRTPIYAKSGSPLNLQPGTYTITTSAQGTVTPQSVKVVSGEKQSINLELQ